MARPQERSQKQLGVIFWAPVPLSFLKQWRIGCQGQLFLMVHWQYRVHFRL